MSFSLLTLQNITVRGVTIVTHQFLSLESFLNFFKFNKDKKTNGFLNLFNFNKDKGKSEISEKSEKQPFCKNCGKFDNSWNDMISLKLKSFCRLSSLHSDMKYSSLKSFSYLKFVVYVIH